MVRLYYRGKGSRQSTFLSEKTKRIARRRDFSFQSSRPARLGYSVVISNEGIPLTRERLRTLLHREEITFIIGDANGLPEDLKRDANEIVSVSPLPVSHALEASILAEVMDSVLTQESEEL